MYSGRLSYLVRGHQIYLYKHVHSALPTQILTIVNGYQDGFNKSFNICLDVMAPAVVGDDILISKVGWDFKSS